MAQVLITCAVGIAIVGSLLAWRLSKGPVSLDFLTPVIESSLVLEDTPLAVQIEDTTLQWGGWRRVFDLRGRNIRVYGSDGRLVALLPEVSIGLSAKGLLRGDFGISRLDVFGLRAVLKRHPDGSFDFSVPAGSGDAQGEAVSFADTTASLLRVVREGKGAFRYLRRFSVLSAKVRYVDELNRQLWTMPAADMITVFRAAMIESRFNLVVENGGARTELAAVLLQDRKTGRIGGRVDFDRLQPTLIARALPQLKQLAGIRMPFSGSAHFDVAEGWHLHGLRLQLASEAGRAVIALQYPGPGERAHVIARMEDVHIGVLARATPALASLSGLDIPVSGQIEGETASSSDLRLLRVSLRAGEGEIELPGILPRRASVAGARLEASLRDDGSVIDVKEFAIDFAGPRLQLAGAAIEDAGIYRFSAEGTVADVPMAGLDGLWPLGIGPPARRWVTTNIDAGTVEAGSFAVSADIPADDPVAARVTDIRGSLRYSGLSVDYLPPMSKFTGVAGTATFDRTRFDLAVTAGRLRDIAVERATIVMFDLDTDVEKIAIDISLRGPARTVAQVLDEQPLGFLGPLGVSPSAVSGDAAVRTELKFPLRRDLKPAMVKVAASGKLGNLAIDPAPRGVTVRDGALAVKADNAAMTATGSLLLSGVPAKVGWREHFAPGSEERRRLAFTGRVPDMAHPGFGLPDNGILSGPGNAEVTLVQRRDGSATLAADLGLRDGALSLPALGWSKAAGVPGTARLALAFDKDGLSRIDAIDVEAGTGRLVLSAEPFGAEREAWIATLERYENSGNDLHGRIELRPDGSIDADLSGKRFDVAGLLDVQTEQTSAEERKLPPIGIRARIADLRWGEERRLTDASMTVEYADARVEGLVLDGKLGRDAAFSLRYLPGPDGQVLRIAADDFGAVLGMSPTRSRVMGGALLIRGVRPAPDAPLEGNFYASRFTLSRAPLLARVLQVASLTGIGDALTRSGLAFDAFEGQYSYQDGKVTFINASAYGSSIGASGNGVLDLGADTVTLSGTLVPAYALNRVLGKIPVIGSLLTGGENEGIIAATYRVEGPIDEAKVEVNPLSALAPGFLRNLFGLGADKPAAAGQ